MAKAGNHVRDIGKRHLVEVDGLAGHLPSAGGMSGLRVAGGKCGSQSDDGTEKPAGFSIFEKVKLSAMSVPPLPR